MTVADALTALLAQLGIPAPQIPPDLPARAALWRSLAAGERMLVLLDDAAGSDQVAPLLPGPGECLVLVTSRRRLLALDAAVPTTLDALSPQAAARLLVAKAGRPGMADSDTDVREVARYCGGLPLAVHVMAARLRHYPARQAGELLADLDAADRRLAALTAEDVSVAAAFDLSYRTLPPARQAVYRRLGWSPLDTVDRHAAAALSGTDPVSAWRCLRDLEEHHLIEEPTPGRYRTHDLIGQHARTLAAAEDPAERAAALARLVEHYRSTAVAAALKLTPDLLFPPSAQAPSDDTSITDAESAQAWFAAEAGNLLAVTRLAAANGDHAATWQLALARSGHLLRRPRLDVLLRVRECAGSAGSPSRPDH